MPERVRVLVFPCGAENASEIHQALRHSLHVELFGASSVDDHGRFRFERYAGGLPNIRDSGFDDAFAELLANWRIDVVFATHDSVHEYLAQRASALGFFLVNGDAEAAAIVRRKTATYGMFSGAPWLPRVFDRIDDVVEWPVLIKPDRGQGGQFVTVVHSRADAEQAVRSIREPVIVEYLPGEELTVDCFSDRHRKVVFAGPRTRERIRAGVSMRSTFRPLTDEIETIARDINARLQLRGPWFFQVKADRDGRWKLMEVCCRVAGTMAAHRARGINLPLLAIQDYLGRDVTTLPNEGVALVDRHIATRAELRFDFDTVIIDLDDTLLAGEYANPVALAFLYQCVQDGKQIKLVTRHEHDVLQTLNRARIAPSLFDEIVHLKARESKADAMTGRAIFIDNHFPERLDVARQTAMPVFDVDALEFFLR